MIFERKNKVKLILGIPLEKKKKDVMVFARSFMGIPDV
jgi:hypothetical protein